LELWVSTHTKKDGQWSSDAAKEVFVSSMPFETLYNMLACAFLNMTPMFTFVVALPFGYQFICFSFALRTVLDAAMLQCLCYSYFLKTNPAGEEKDHNS
jgi:hypothetical protein